MKIIQADFPSCEQNSKKNFLLNMSFGDIYISTNYRAILMKIEYFAPTVID